MRGALALAAGLFLSFGANAASVESAPTRDYSKTLDQANLRFLKEFRQLIEAKGFSEVAIVPQLFVVNAKGQDGNARTLIIDSNTLKVYPLDQKLPEGKISVPETTLTPMH